MPTKTKTKTPAKKADQFQVTLSIPDERIRGLLCSAFEGGSNYWYFIEDQILAKGLKLADFGEGGKMQVGQNYWHWAQLIPLVPGCALAIRDREDDSPKPKLFHLDRAAIERGLLVMQRDFPKHFGDFLAENDDAETGDVFLQCCLFGELVYG